MFCLPFEDSTRTLVFSMTWTGAVPAVCDTASVHYASTDQDTARLKSWSKDLLNSQLFQDLFRLDHALDSLFCHFLYMTGLIIISHIFVDGFFLFFRAENVFMFFFLVQREPHMCTAITGKRTITS